MRDSCEKGAGIRDQDSFFQTVSHLFFSMQVACRQLGFFGAKRFYTHGGGTGPTWLDDVNCRGTEKSLLECKHRGIGVENCGKVLKSLSLKTFVAPFIETQLTAKNGLRTARHLWVKKFKLPSWTL